MQTHLGATGEQEMILPERDQVALLPPCPIPKEPLNCTESQQLQPGAVAKEVAEGQRSCNDVFSPHSLPTLQGSGAQAPGTSYGSCI